MMMTSNRRYLLLLSLILLAAVWIGREFFSSSRTSANEITSEKSIHSKEVPGEPNDWFFAQRAFPHGEINLKKFRQAQLDASAMKLQKSAGNRAAWALAGPVNVGGRISDLAVHPASLDTIYAGAASGGVFKSVDGGQNWRPIFDEAFSLSIGDVTLDPTNPDIVYVGTGEVNAGGGSQTYPGNGLYRSRDGGENWAHLGLGKTENIARVVIDPDNPQRIFVAAMGSLFKDNPERGIFRSIDGGNSWERSLFLTDSTGAIDLVMNPDSPDTVYAAMWERVRRPHRRSYGGLSSGIYRSTDGGDNWEQLINGIPTGSMGRISLAISASNPEILYALFVNTSGSLSGAYKSIDHGNSWERTGDESLFADSVPYWWWFGNVRVDPNNPEIAFVLGLNVWRTTNGGSNWFYSSGNMHVDHHGLEVHPHNSNVVVAGNDGGIYISNNGGGSYRKSTNLPITQFYTAEIDFQEPHRLYGGTQDNGTNRTLTGNIDDWHEIYGGDGMHVLVDPTDNRFIYVEYQRGNLFRSINGGASFSWALNGVNGNDRNNWNSPLAMNPLDPRILYFGTHRVYRSSNRAASWKPISPDLSNGHAGGNLTFGTITTIAASPADTSVLYAGTDDGNVWVRLASNGEWQNISGGFPERWITRVAPDPIAPMTAYVTISGYRWAEPLPHIFRTTNAGGSWEAIAGNLPEVPLNDVIVDPQDTATLYVASDVGVFVTANLGANWEYLGEGLPNVPVNDIVLHNPTRTLVAATFGRSMHKISLDPLTGIPGPTAAQPRHFQLAQNYPNPFNGETVIEFSLENAAPVSIEIYNSIGQKIKTVVESEFASGRHQVKWDGTDAAGNPVTSGNFIYRLKSGGHVQAKRMILSK